MAYLKLGDVRKFAIPSCEFVGMVARCEKVGSSVPARYGYVVATTSGIVTKVEVGKAKITSAEVSANVRKLLYDMCVVDNAIDEAEGQISKYTKIITANQKKRAKLWDDLADIHYNRVK